MASAQLSMEFFVLLSLGLLVAIAFEVASLDQLKQFRIEKENEAVKDLALKIQKELIVAATVEDGYVRYFTVPERIDRINYTITTLNSTLIVKSENGFYLVSIPKIIGNVTNGTNIINKTGGVVHIIN